MKAQIVSGLTPTKVQLDCIKAVYTMSENSSFQSAHDERGDAFVFDRTQEPAMFIEVIRTEQYKVRGNHVHQACTESFNVVDGALDFYLLCVCPERHVYHRTMHAGDSVHIEKSIAHAMYSLEKTEFVAIFDHDPRNDRERVTLLVF